MKKQDLSTLLDKQFLDKLFGFCYSRTNNHYEAEDLSSEIVLEIIKQSKTNGDIDNPETYVWKIARNVYAKYSERRKIERVHSYEGDPDDVLANAVDEEYDDSEDENLKKVFRAISFLSRSYRDVMVSFYFDGKSTSTIAKELNIKETTVRQRLFSARNEIRDEVNTMDTINRPTQLKHIEYEIWGTGSPAWSDPRNVCDRELSRHIMHLCSDRPYSAKELSEELNVPMIYIEDELNILEKGEYGRYGVLREVKDGKYSMNFVLLNKEQTIRAWNIYQKNTVFLCDIALKFIKEHEKEYLAVPYLNKSVTLNDILWSQIHNIGHIFNRKVKSILSEKYFPNVKTPDRPFSVYGWEDFGKTWFGGCDGASANNVLGYSYIQVQNIYSSSKDLPISKHFSCGLNIGNDSKMQMAIRAINGLDVSVFSDIEKEVAAKAIEEDYIYREGDKLYTKFLVIEEKNNDIPNNISNGITDLLTEQADKTAKELASFIKKTLPEHLVCEYRFVADLASMPVAETLILSLIEKKVLKPLEKRLNSETVFMTVKK